MNATHALGWALVHFLWQGAALALPLAAGLTISRGASAQTRYTLSLVTLTAMLIVPLATGIALYHPRAAIPSTSVPAPSVVSAATESPAPAPILASVSTTAQPIAHVDRRTAVRALVTPLLPWLVVVWVIGVVALSLRLAYGWISARRLRTTGTRATAAALQQALSRLAQRMRVSRPVQLVESILVEVPAVIGWLRPVILVPASALTGLTPQQLEVLLAHELAHVRRYDYVVNLIQCVIETLLFYHPAVWWVSRQVREEREHCCDDLVVGLCGDRRLYASALVEMERLRPEAPRLALAATGGSLLHRVRRLVAPDTPNRELFPRWAAGLAGVMAVTVALLAAGNDRLAGEPVEPERLAVDTTRTAPDTVLRHPDPSQPLAQRWDWARTQARQLGKRTYWIGYQISRADWLEHSVFIDRETEVVGENIRISGHLFGDFQGLVFRGVRLAPLTGTTDSDDIAILFGFTGDRGGTPTLTNVHVASIYLPMDFRGRTLLWLGRAGDAQSIPLVEGLFASTTPPELRQDIVSAVGIHGSSGAVVPILIRWLNSREPTDVRSQAAEWLGFHPSAAAVAALSRAARSDQAEDVRHEAAEALGDNTLPAALDSTIAIAKTAADPEARREAVEGLGDKTEERALTALVSIAQSDRDEDVQREAVETLGEMPGGRGLNAVRDIARTHPSPEVRREAVETLGQNLETGAAIAALKPIATGDPDSDVRREAIETLGEIAPNAETVRFLTAIAKDDRSEDAQREAIETLAEIGELGMPAVMEIARMHSSPDVRRTALEEVVDHMPADQALELLAQAARRDPDSDVQREAVESLGQLHDDRAYRLLVEFARTHPVSDVRREAVETLGESGKTDSVIAVLDDIVQTSADQDVAREALETLAELQDPRALARVARIARRNGDVDVRREAIEKYAEHASPDSAVALLKGILAGDAPEDVYSEVLESLEEVEGGAGIPVLIDAARSHPNREVRADALRRLAESDDPRAQKVFDQTLRRP